MECGQFLNSINLLILNKTIKVFLCDLLFSKRRGQRWRQLKERASFWSARRKESPNQKSRGTETTTQSIQMINLKSSMIRLKTYTFCLILFHYYFKVSISEIAENDSGEWKCIAENSMGSAKDSK